MSREIIKWINANSYFPFGEIIYKYYSENSSYTNLNEFLLNLLHGLDIEYITIKPNHVNDRNIISKNYLCYNLIGETIDKNSIKFEVKYENAKKFDFVVIKDFDKKFQINFKHLSYYFTINFHILLFIFVILGVLTQRFELINSILILQSLVIMLLFEYSYNKDNTTISSICHTKYKKNVCRDLQEKSGLLLKYFEFSEAGLIYFITIYIESIYIIFYQSYLDISSLFLYFSGILIVVYSSIKQFNLKNTCPICIFVSICIVLNVLLICYEIQLLTIVSIFNVLVTFIAVYIGYFIVNSLKLLRNYQRLAFRNEFITREIILNNAFSISRYVENVSFDTKELIKYSFKYRTDSSKNVCLIINTKCKACISLMYKIRCLSNSKFDFNIIFQIDNFGNAVENLQIVECIYLALIFEELGIFYLGKYIEELHIVSNRVKYLESILNEKSININEKKTSEVLEKLKQQNNFINVNRILEFPYVFKEDKIIPPYIDPKFYGILF